MVVRVVISALLSILFVVSSASAVESRSESTSFSLFEPPSQSPWRIFGGVTFGRESVSGSEYGNSPSGTEFTLSALVSYQLPRWVMDGGLGWMYSSVSGTNSAGNPISIRTRAGFVDSSVRYRLSERWQLGPAVDIAFGTDTGLGPGVSKAAEATVFAGLRGVYEFPAGRLPVRLLAQGLTDVSISERRIYSVMGGIQLGIPIAIHHKEYEEEPIRVSRAAPEREEAHEVRILLDPQRVFFGTNSSVIRPGVEKALRDVGEYLRKNSTGWSVVEISGHADRRGRFKYNLKLSERRARSVLTTLADGGADLSKMSAQGFSYLKPIDPRNNPEGWSRNRRVELVFRDVQRPAALRERLEHLREVTFKEGMPK